MLALIIFLAALAYTVFCLAIGLAVCQSSQSRPTDHLARAERSENRSGLRSPHPTTKSNRRRNAPGARASLLTINPQPILF
jgi:hypothetical protein